MEVVITKPHGEPKAVVLLFHGCQHSAVDWGYPSPTCPSCLGKPGPTPRGVPVFWSHAAIRLLLAQADRAVVLRTIRCPEIHRWAFLDGCLAPGLGCNVSLTRNCSMSGCHAALPQKT